MKNYFKTLLLLFVSVFVFHLEVAAQQSVEILDFKPEPRKVYIGFGSGINAYPGMIGFMVEVPVIDKLGIVGSAGIGSWGGKLGIHARYYFKSALGGSGLSLGISRASGLADFESEMELLNGDTGTVIMDLDAVSTANIAYFYAINLRDKNKITLSVGLSFALQRDNYTITNGAQLSETSEAVMNILQPGGLVVGFDFLFGAGKN